MCGRYTLSNPSALQLRFNLTEFADVRLPPLMHRHGRIAHGEALSILTGIVAGASLLGSGGGRATILRECEADGTTMTVVTRGEEG